MNQQISRVMKRSSVMLGMVVASSLLTACYVVPINQPYPSTPAPAGVVIAPEMPVHMSARLYPANEAATPYGMLTANVTNQLNGKGQFTVNVAGEILQGEATRTAGSSRSGTASATGSRGSYMQCSYTMNNASMGSGTCSLNNGARFSMHVGG